MYAAYFGLKEAPFRLTPDPTYLYMSAHHREALAHLLYGISAGGGFVQLTGDVGTGKTTLCRALLAQLPPQVDVALILNPRLTIPEFLASVCDELKIPYPRDTTSPKVFVDALDHYLLDAHARGRRTVLLIDEAQGLSVEVLEQVRLLTNLETTSEKLLQIILIGQPELVPLLARDDLRQLAQRITARYHLEPFTEPDTHAYVRHRLQVAGGRRGLFSEAAIRRIHAESRGVPRLINIICDRALLGAYAQDKRRIEPGMVARAAAEIRGRGTRARSVASWRWVTAAAFVAAVVIGGMALAPEHLARRLGFRLLSAVSIAAGFRRRRRLHQVPGSRLRVRRRPARGRRSRKYWPTPRFAPTRPRRSPRSMRGGDLTTPRRRASRCVTAAGTTASAAWPGPGAGPSSDATTCRLSSSSRRRPKGGSTRW